MSIKSNQQGFTLIELVVVIVVLGILAATAIPRFANVSDDARSAVAQGVVGSIMSSAALQFAQYKKAVDFATIVNGTDLSSSDDVWITDGTNTKQIFDGATSAQTSLVSSDLNCSGAATTFTVYVCSAGTAQATCTAATTKANGTLRSSLCNN